MADPTPLRFRTYLWFPVLTVGSLALAGVVTATVGASAATAFLAFSALAGLYVSALLGVHGLFRDATELAEADAPWQPSWRRYLAGAVVVASLLATVVLTSPGPVDDVGPLGPVGVFGTVIVSLALVTGPVCAGYLLVRWRRIGLNYL